MTERIGNLIERETDRVVVARLEMADTFWKRSVGLLGRWRLEPGTGLWIAPCNGVHTWGMRFAIDVLFLDGEGKVLRLVENLQPWCIAGPVRGARVVVEVPAHALIEAGVQAGRHYVARYE